MAQETGDRLSVGQKLTRWAAMKMAAYAGVELSLSDPKGWKPLMGARSSAGKTVNPDTAMQVSTVFGCVRLLSESVGQLPIAVYEREKNGNAKKIDHDLGEILALRPNIDMTGVEFKEAMQVNLGLQGNGYALREVNGAGNVVSLYPVPAHQMRPTRNKATGDIEYELNDRGKPETLPREKVWHLKGFGATGLIGYSPIGVMRNAMGLAMAAEEFGARMFERGVHTSGIVKIPQWLKPEQRAAAQENLQKVYAGLENSHKLMLLEGGMEFDGNAAMMPPGDLQLLELRQFQVAEICRIYGVPPHMVADLTRSTNNNIEHQALEFVTFSLLPWLRRWEISANRWLLKPAEQRRYFVQFNFDGLLRADSVARADYLTRMVANGVMNKNEARAKENLNRVEGQGMDEFTVQSNMISVQDLTAVANAMRKQGKAPDWAGNVH